MAILVDLSQTIISVAFQQLKGDYNKDLARAMVFQTLISYKKKFGSKYGDVYLAIDSRGKKSWRKEKYPWYKAQRAEKFENPKEKERWEKIFEVANQIVQECQEYLTWKTIGFPGAEADDVIAVLSEAFSKNGEPVLIISSDGDFYQLQKFAKIEQYSAIQKKYVQLGDPIEFLHNKILTGDPGDGIPNILSPNNSLVEKIRQKSITSKITKEWMESPSDMFNKYKGRIDENTELIDFGKIPKDIRTGILQAYKDAPSNSFQGLYKFFVSVRMTRILSDLEFFKVKNGDGNAKQANLCADEDFFDGGTF